MLWILFSIAALLGHLALCLYASNYLNATIANRTLRHCLSMPVEAFLILLPPALAVTAALGYGLDSAADWKTWQYGAAGYVSAAAVVGVLFVPRWLYQQLTAQPPALLLSNHTTVVDMTLMLAGETTTALGRVYHWLPGNQSLTLSIHEKTLALAELPEELNGLTITHFSDLHFTGHVPKAYFQQLVEQANALNSDLIAITGDIVDSRACVPWIAETLGRLRAPQGMYFVLGNHDVRAGAQQVRQALVDCGFIDLSGRWIRQTIHGRGVVLAGNELPWFKPAACMKDCPRKDGDDRDFRIALSHSPDQFAWSQTNGFDLMLAGHTHGGQIRFPVIGPILAPSRYGVRYCAGTYDLGRTVMHVTRGISGLQPLRYNCPPELTKLILTRSGAG